MTAVATAVATPPAAESRKAAAPADPADAAAFSSQLDTAQAELDSAVQGVAAKDAPAAATPDATAAPATALPAAPTLPVGSTTAATPAAPATPAAALPQLAAPVATAPALPAVEASAVPLLPPVPVAQADVPAAAVATPVMAQLTAAVTATLPEAPKHDDDPDAAPADITVPAATTDVPVPLPLPVPAPLTPPASAAPLAGGTSPAATPVTAAAATGVSAPAAPADQSASAATAPLVVPDAPAAPPVFALPPTPTSTPAASAPVAAFALPSAAADIPPLATQLARPLLGLRSAGDGNHILTISVTPENLGPVTVRAHVSGDSVRIELLAPTDQAREALKAIMPDLRRDLSQSGGQTSLDLFSGGQGGAGTFRDSDAAPRQPAASRLLGQEGTPRPRSTADSLLDVLA